MAKAQSVFWCLRSPASTNRLAEWVDDEIELEQVRCPLVQGHRRGGKRLTNLSIMIPTRTVQDFVWTWYSECLMQDHVVSLFRREGFTGFDVKPVKARFIRGGEKPPTLWELVVSGWAGLAPAQTGITRLSYCEACQYVEYSGCSNPEWLIDKAQWDGSDFFIVWPLPGFIFVTERVAQCIRDHHFKGAVLKDVSELRGLGESGFTPGRLSRWMPEAVARTRGAAAGIQEV